LDFVEGFGEIDSFVCEDCIGEDFLAAYCRANPSSEACTYCQNTRQLVVTNANGIVEKIYQFFLAYYADVASSGMPYDSGEAAFPHAIMSTSEILFDALQESSESFLEDVASAIVDDPWVYCGDGGSWADVSESERKYNAWRSFSGKTKHQSRYFFFQKEDEGHFEPDSYEPREMLKVVSSDLQNLNLLATVEFGRVLYRSRLCGADSYFQTFSDLGPPSNEYASAGRMNPIGIAYGYFGFDKKTAVLEVASSPPFNASVGEFSLKRDIKVLDLSRLADAIPSIFDIENRGLRESSIFLNYFVTEISKPFFSDGSHHIEYVPTQIFSEYLNHVYKTPDDESVDGIIYRSAANDGGRNIVLFPPKDLWDKWDTTLQLDLTERIEFTNWNQLNIFIA